MKVFGLGLNKTGTTTLAQCFKHFGLHHLTCRRNLLEAYRAGRIEEIFAEIEAFDSFEDWPYPLMYEEIFARYGAGARYILTTRLSIDVWLASLKRHALRTHPDRHCRLLAYGYDYPHGFEAEHAAFYERHNDRIRHFFATPERSSLLLEVCWERGDGWPALCRFLGYPVPDLPFPHLYRGDRAPVDPERKRANENRIALQLETLCSGSAPDCNRSHQIDATWHKNDLDLRPHAKG